MTPSLYQRSVSILFGYAGSWLLALGSWEAPATRVPRAHSPEPGACLKVVLKVPFRPHATPDPEDVCRDDMRIQLYVVAASLPRVARAAEEVVDLEAATGLQAEGSEVKVDPAGVGVVRVDVHHTDDDVLSRCFAVADDLFAVGRVESQRAVLLQG